jgi:hypothetical protein
MTNEWLAILIMTLSGALFAIGGTGWKPARRYVLPVLLAVTAYFSHISWWQCLGMAVTLIVALSAGYGERTPYWRKALVFAGYGLSFLWIGWTWWIVITPVVCLGLFWLSNNKLTARTFFWKAVELLYGALIGITFIVAISPRA